uniref:Tyrosine-protein kinase ephrin type A/B receptor-like domain-containing protein n=1 Tax=Tetradesmus obliquus TaxID=3088 RepID=A0A383VXC6_TETOB|eukprot:jgi/Sobl393_1/8554/SZX69513.1
MTRACLITLVAFAVISCAAASRILEDDAAAMGRELLQIKADPYVCSAYCEQNKCIRVGTTGNVKCNQCKATFRPILSGVNAGQCGCPAGTYFDPASGGSCIVCPFGSYCFKQLTWVANGASATGKTDCAEHLTTRARRSTSAWDCVNMGGYALDVSGTEPAPVPCTDNTYAIAKSKQKTCTPCPSGMVVTGTDRSSPSACMVPKGYFLKSPGQIAPCDQGSYQDKDLAAQQASVGSCIPCQEGVTTKDKGSTAASDCNRIKPGYVATAVTDGAITTAVLCPQGYYCVGSAAGDTAAADKVTITELTQTLVNGKQYISGVTPNTDLAAAKITACPNNAWTKTVGATAVDQCMVPPGFELDADTVKACTGNKYRSQWISLASAVANKCVSCGTDVQAEEIEPITLYSLNLAGDANTDYTVLNTLVRASSKSCFIVKGQGMYYISDPTTKKMVYKAKDCGAGATGFVPDSYGVADKVYGLAQTPCKLCPAGTKVDTTQSPSNTYMVTSPSNAGFFNPLACVTKAGYGWDGRAATLCAKGWYNAGNNYKACTQCAYGLTTPVPDVNTVHIADTDCKVAPGFGEYDDKLQLCPIGTYNNALQVRDTQCTDCTAFTWTEEEGSDASTDCTVCKPGYGGTSSCSLCGGSVGTYGPAGRDTKPCEVCPVSAVGFQFFYGSNSYPYPSPARAVSGAQDAADCVAGMAQIEDGLWFLAGAEGATATSEASIADCATACLGDATCALATFDYAAGNKCKMLKIATEATDDAIVTAFKAVPSSDVSQSRKLQAAKPKAVSTGMYTQWWYDGSAIGTQTPATAANKAACFDACDAADNCAGVVYTKSGSVCKLITGETAPDGVNVAKRSLTKAEPGRFIKEPAR